MEYPDAVCVLPSECRFNTYTGDRTCIHTFSAASLLTAGSQAHAGSSAAITALAQSPAIDVVGIGFASGEISVYDVRMDERLLRMKMQDGAIRALSFRTGMSLKS